MRGVSPENLVVAETFRSIQGESTYGGLPCFFVRLAGCNLSCMYCDTEYARHIQAGEHEHRTVESIIAGKNPNDRLVCITGGEPLLQEGSLVLMDELLKRKCTVLLETNGSMDISTVPKEVIKIMDIKCPGSGMEHQNRYENLKFLTKQDQLKFVISSKKDFEFAAMAADRHELDRTESTLPYQSDDRDDRDDRPQILVSPASPFCYPSDLAKWLLESGRNWRLQLQLHKFIWPERDRGV